MAKRDYVQLAHVFDPKKSTPAGWYASEKLDGMRAWWDGGASRDIPASHVPYANTAKDGRYIEEVISTGLWSRYGNVIHAPAWFLDALPRYPLDGELWIKRNSWQALQKVIKDLIPGPGWNDVKYMVFDSPHPTVLFSDGDITVQNYKVFLRDCYRWWSAIGIGCVYGTSFEQVYKFLEANLVQTDNLKLHIQTELPFSTPGALAALNTYLDKITDQGAEGIMLRKPSAMWEPKRSYNILKVKKFMDAEATVLGYTTGRATDKGSKLLGMMGALITSFNGHRLELSGFTEEERTLSGYSDFPRIDAFQWATANPKQEVPEWITNTKFPRGSQVTFRYRELSDTGIPKEARYWRKA